MTPAGTVDSLRTRLLNPSRSLHHLITCGEKVKIYLRISRIAIEYYDMEGVYASLPEHIRQTLTSESCVKDAQKIYAAAILGPQTSASAISGFQGTSAHLPQWPITNESRYAPIARN